jgi:N-acetylmuramoyl-L-alanine amidase
MRYKYHLLWIIIAFAIFLFPAVSYAVSIGLMVNGEMVKGDVDPVLTNGRTLVPIRFVMEKLGTEYSWDNSTKTLTITSLEKEIKLPIGKQEVTVNGQNVKIDVPAMLIKGRTMVPLRFVGEALGAEVIWDNVNKLVIVNKKLVEIYDIQLTEEPDGFLLSLCGNGDFKYNAADEEGSTKIIINNAYFPMQEKAFAVMKGSIEGIEIVQVPEEENKVLINVASSQPLLYKIAQAGNGLQIRFYYQVSKIEMKKDSLGESFLIYTDGSLSYQAMQLTGPDRFVVDVPQTVLNLPQLNIPFEGSEVVSRVRTSQFSQNPNTVRLVFDLKKPLQGYVTQEDHGLTVSFQPKVTAVETQKSNGKVRVIITASQPITANLSLDRGTNSMVAMINNASWGINSSDIPVGDGLINRITGADKNGGTEIRVMLNYYYKHSIVPTNEKNKLIIDIFQSPIVGKKIVIDPGHGGNDVGTIGPSRLYEKDVNLDISNRLVAKLRQIGVEVIPTRTVDTTLKLEDRTNLANGVEADLFLSIHNNGNVSPTSRGTEVYYYATNPDSCRFATLLQNELIRLLGLEDRKVKSANFYVLRNTKMTSALAEIAFVTNPAEEKLLMDPSFREKAADALFRGILKYYEN